MLSKMFQRGASSATRPEVRKAASSLFDEYLMNSTGLLSSIRRMMFSQNRKDNDRRDFQAEFEKFKKFSKEEEEKEKREKDQGTEEAKKEESYEEQVRRKHQQRADESEEAFKEQQEKLKDKFEKTKDKDSLSFFDVFSDVKEELGNRLKASGEFMSRTSSKISEKASQTKEALKKKEPEQKTEQEGEQAKEETVKKEEEEGAKMETKEEKEEVKKKSEQVQYNLDRRSYVEKIGDKFSERRENIFKRVEEKSPGFYRFTSSISSNLTRYWEMTFPNYEKRAVSKMNKLKQEGENTLTEEELEQIQSQIPEWKRSALQVSEEKNPNKRRSMLRKMRDKMSEKVKQTDQYKKLRETDSYKKYSEFKDDYKEFRENLKEEVEASPNKFVSVSRQLYDRAKSDSPFAKALLKMRQRDPEFEIEGLKAQIPYIVHPLYAEYLDDNIEYLEKCCEDHALGYLKSRIKARHNRKVIPKYKVPIFVDEAYFLGGKLGEKGEPQFIYSIRIEEINCLLCRNNPEEIKEGDDDSILGSHFRLVVEPHDSPDLQLMGHYWKFVEFEKIQETEMLV